MIASDDEIEAIYFSLKKMMSTADFYFGAIERVSNGDELEESINRFIEHIESMNGLKK